MWPSTCSISTAPTCARCHSRSASGGSKSCCTARRLALRYSEHYVGGGQAFFAAAHRLHVEGIVSKRLDAPYVPGDRGLWRKAKWYHREEFIIVGFTDPEGGRPYLSSLLLGYHDAEGRLRYAGRGAGNIPERELRRLYGRLTPLVTDTSPLDEMPPSSSRFGSPLKLSDVHWVRPELVCETRFLAWTADGMLRQAVYQGLRDTPPKQVRHTPPREAAGAQAAGANAAQRKRPRFTRANIQHRLSDAVAPSRDELARYWQAVGPLALQHLGRRPMTLVRSVGGVTFFHEGPLPPVPSAVHHFRFRKRDGSEGVRVWVDDVAGLLGLVEMDAVELHPWGGHGGRHRASRPAGVRPRSGRGHRVALRQRERLAAARIPARARLRQLG
jgi:bifunctional non-homologous end joining protein LigD